MYLWCIYQALVGADNMTTIIAPHLLLYPRVVLDTARDICPCPVLLDPSELVLSLLVVKCYWSVMAEVWRIKCATSEFYGCLWCRRSPPLWSRRTYHSALSKIHLHQLPRIHFQNTLSWLTVLTRFPGKISTNHVDLAFLQKIQCFASLALKKDFVTKLRQKKIPQIFFKNLLLKIIQNTI